MIDFEVENYFSPAFIHLLPGACWKIHFILTL